MSGAQGRQAYADGEWHRLHPLTPALRSWRILVVVLVIGVQNGADNLLSGDFNTPPDVNGRLLAGGGAIILVVLAVGVVYSVLSWRMSRFRVGPEALELYTGVLFRQHRQARLDRLQAVDVVQPFLARLTGLARLTLEVAGGSGSAVSLSYLTDGQAQSLRNHLLARAAGVRYDTDEAPEAPEQVAVSVGAPRLVLSLALSGPSLALALGTPLLIVVALAIGNVGPLLGIVPTAFGAISLLWQRFAGQFGFLVATSPDGLRLRHGLLEHRTQTVPPGRVQAVRLSQPLLWRIPDWWQVHANVAGYGGSSAEDAPGTESTLLPVGSRAEAIAVLSLVLPDAGVQPGEHPGEVVDAGLSGSTPTAGYVVVPRRARWVDPIAWRRTGFRVTSAALLIRRGRLRRALDVVPHARTQSVGLRQGPLQRRLRLVSFTLHSTPGPVSPEVPHLDAATAARLLAEQVDRARAARASSGPERWMER